MLKAFGVILMLFSGLFFGIYFVQKEERRVKSLKELESFSVGLLSSLKYNCIPIDDYIFNESKKENATEFLKKCTFYNSDSYDFHIGWNRAAEVSFDKADIQLVKEFGEKLGTSDLEGQLSYVEYYIEEINSRINLAKEKKIKAEKSGVPLFSCLGLGLAIMII